MTWRDGSGKVEKSLAQGRVAERRNLREQSIQVRDLLGEPQRPALQDGKRGMMGNSLGAMAEARSCFLRCRKTFPLSSGVTASQVGAGWKSDGGCGRLQERKRRDSFSFAPLSHQCCSFPNKYLTLNQRASALCCSHVLAQIFPLASRSSP